MRVQNVRERALAKFALQQIQGLRTMRVISRINQDGLCGIAQKDVVGRKPAALEKMDTSWKIHTCNQFAAFSVKRNFLHVTKVVADLKRQTRGCPLIDVSLQQE